MFEITIDGADELLKKFETLAAQITALQQTMPKELVSWQSEDMHRKFPNIESSSSGQETTASTEIWPRSRRSEDRPHTHTAGRSRGPTMHQPKRTGPGGRPPPSTRPILRPELETTLHDRMVALVSEAMKWPST
jgi:hypothetical protein